MFAESDAGKLSSQIVTGVSPVIAGRDAGVTIRAQL